MKSHHTPTFRKKNDYDKDRAGRERLNEELPDVRGEDRMWSDAALDELAGRAAGDPKDSDMGPMDIDLSPEELMKRMRLMGPGELSAMLQRRRP